MAVLAMRPYFFGLSFCLLEITTAFFSPHRHPLSAENKRMAANTNPLQTPSWSRVATLLLGNTNASMFNVADFGAKGDGKTDNTASFQTALNFAGQAKGGIVLIPAGMFLFTGNLSVPQAVVLQGVYRYANIPTLRGSSVVAVIVGHVHTGSYSIVMQL
ncbi:mannuronan C5-epimerase AlgE3-like [Corticium candelabrum]|uniref:mannuronan C5-epimerase AlgE3-like n=1 Tax=Corticium candelabrum TaxID=121492 RepID=UPI002E264AED|nr:mannuronan C5-epimerase AlgE3-like [Corticium candelabrum]